MVVFFAFMKHEEKDILTIKGGPLKALGDMRVGGWLVKYSDADSPDLTGDYFDASTNFGNVKSSPILVEHSMDADLGDIEIGEVQHIYKDAGVWVEGQLQVRAEYEDFLSRTFGPNGPTKFLGGVYKLVEMEKMGWSSGVPGHRVKRTPITDPSTGTIKAYHIDKWPLGLDASLTVQPAEPRAKAVAIKSLITELALNEGQEVEAEATKDVAPITPVDADTKGVLPDNQQQQTTETMTEENNGPLEPQTDAVAESLKAITDLLQKQNARLEAVENAPKQETKAITEAPSTKAAGIITKRGDNFGEAFVHYMKTADPKALAGHMAYNDMGQQVVEIKASNATDMNVGTNADGGFLTTDDMANEIISRADEQSLAARAGVRRYRSNSQVLDIPVSAEADGEFIATTEANTFDQDAPAIGQKTLTKVAYTKYTDVSYQLLQASVPDVMRHIAEEVAMGKAKTDNDLFITEVETNGTQFKIFAGTAAIAVDELEEVAINDTNAFYIENPDDAKWIMRPSTHRAILTLDDTSIRRYSENQLGSLSDRTLLQSDVLWSNKCEAIGSGLKPVLFGNFNYVAQLEDPTLQFLLDPYTVAIKGQKRLLWYYQTDFAVLQANAVGFGRNITT